MDLPGNDTESSGVGHSGTDSAPVVTPEEVGLVLLVLLLWVVAIALFINRWGKIRMLEPSQPAYKMTQPGSLTVQSSQINSPDEDAVISHYLASHRSPDRPRQNSLMVPMASQLTAARKVKSAVDLVSLVIAEQREQRDCLNSGVASSQSTQPGPSGSQHESPQAGSAGTHYHSARRGTVTGHFGHHLAHSAMAGGVSAYMSGRRQSHCPISHTSNV